MNKTQIENAYLSAFCDRDLTKVFSAEEKAVLFEQRAEVKVKLREKLTDEERSILQAQFEELTNQIEGKN